MKIKDFSCLSDLSEQVPISTGLSNPDLEMSKEQLDFYKTLLLEGVPIGCPVPPFFYRGHKIVVV